jgi:urease accessory protein
VLVINKTDLAPYVHASLEVMREDSARMRPGKPFVFTNCMTGEGIDELVELLLRMVLFDKPMATGAPSKCNAPCGT